MVFRTPHLLLYKRNNRRNDWYVADGTGVAFASGVFYQTRIAGPEAVQRAITEADFELPGENDDVLSPWRRMPVEKLPYGTDLKENVLRRLRELQGGMRLYTLWLSV